MTNNGEQKISWYRRVSILVVKYRPVSILVASYFVVFVFILAFVEINKANWFILAAPFQPIAFLLAGLVAAPLVLAFLWERIKSIKIGDLEIGLSDVEKKVSDTPLNELAAHDYSPHSTEVLELIKTTLRNVEGTKILRMSLGKGETWTVAHMYLLVALLEDFTDTQQILFSASLNGDDIHFLGLVTPPTLRRSLAKEYPELERTYRGIYSSILADAIGIRRQRNARQDTTQFMLDFIIRTFLSALVQTQDSTLRDWVTSSLLERLLGSSLIRNTVTLAKGASRIKKDLLFSLIIDNTDRELTTAPLESSVRFFVIVEGKRLIVVDVLELTIRIADNALQTSASAKSK